MEPVDPQQYIREAECIYSADEVSEAMTALALGLNIYFENKRPVVLSVMNGAVFFVGQLMPQLTFPLELSYVHASRYENGVEGHEIKWIASPNIDIKDRSVLILDDILDEGVTLKAIVEKCYSLGANQVKTAVLVEKKLEKEKTISADYVGFEVPDRYVFGCGMDVYGWWRNLPEIYALKST
jgi:hypoxanthine phosphoribosyltransferase